jgi:hypothetical protein
MIDYIDLGIYENVKKKTEFTKRIIYEFGSNKAEG